MKKFISVILAAALFAGTLTAVGADDNQVQTNEIIMSESTEQTEQAPAEEETEEEEKEAVPEESEDPEETQNPQNPEKTAEPEEAEKTAEPEQSEKPAKNEKKTETEENTAEEQESEQKEENAIALFGNENSDVILDETFDNDTGEFIAHKTSLLPNPVIKYTYTTEENHSDSDDSGSIKAVPISNGTILQHGQGNAFGIEKRIGVPLKKGTLYAVSAWVKSASKKQIMLSVVSDKYFNDGSYWWQGGISDSAKATLTTNDEWQKIVFFYAPSSNTDANYYLRISGVQNVNYSDKETFYFDDVNISAAPAVLELTDVKPVSETVLTALYAGITAEFNLPVGNDNKVTVTDGNGNAVAHKLKVDGTKLIVEIPNRVQDETYNVVLTRVTAANGAVYNGTEMYSYTADERIMNETFDKDMGTFGTSKWLNGVQNCYDWSSTQNHTPGKQNGAALLRTNADFWGSNSAAIGIDSDLGKGIVAGQKYVVSAYIKGEPRRYKQGFQFQMGIYRFNTNAYVMDITSNPPAKIGVTDEWQEIVFVWTAPKDLSNLKLRIGPVNNQECDKTEADYYIFYIDDISISKLDPIRLIDSESYPQNGGEGVNVNGEYSFKFNKEVDASLFKTEYVKLYDTANDIYVDCATTVDGDTINVKTAYPLLYEHDYKFIFDGAIAADSKGIVALDANSEVSFTTQKNVISYRTVSSAGGKIKLSVTNNTGSEVSAYAVAAVYENGLSVKNAVIPVTLSANEQNKVVEIDTGLSKLSAYEIYFWDKADGSNVKSLANVQNKPDARTQLTDNADTWQAGYFVTEDKVDFKGQIGTKRVGLPVIVRVIRENEADGVEFAKLVRAEEVISGADGYVSYSFKVPAESEALRYKVYIDESDGNGNVIESETAFVYASQDNINEALKKIDESSFENMDKAFTDTEGGTKFSVRETLNLMNVTDFDKISAKKYVYRCIIAGKKDGTYESRGIDEFTALFNKAVKTAILAEGDPIAAAEDLKANHASDYWSISPNGETSAYKAFLNDFDKDTKAKVLSKLVNESTGFGDNERVFNFAVVKENILMGDYNSAVSVLKKYSDIVTVNYSTYNSLSNKGKDSANSKFFNSVSSIEDLDKLAAKFEEIAAEVKKTDKTNDGGGSGGGTGGGSGSSSGTYLPGMVDTNKPAPEWYVDEKNTTGDNSLFSDLANAQWAVQYINRLYNLGAINGKADGIFAPSDNMTREELCKVIVLALGIKANDKEVPVFNDVDSTAWYAEYINICAQNGIINGIGDNLFGVGRTVTREEAATILVRAAENAGITLDYDFTIFPFNDEAQISDWAKTSVSVLYESLILDGMENGDFAPKENVTRAQAAKMIVGVIDFKY